MKRQRRLIATMACLGLLAAACGDDDGASEGGETTEADGETTEADETTDGDGDTTEADGETTDGDTEPTEGDTGEPAEVETDTGVDDETIKVGMLADLSGAFSGLVQEVVEAQEVYWDQVNENGGIAGRQVELVIEDNAYDVATNQEKYDVIRNEVAILSQVTGSPHTAAISDRMVDDDIVGIPLTWYSGWADPDIGENVLETYTNYCLESMNGLEWLNTNEGVESVAIISFPGEYGEDGATGAHMAAEQLGLEVVYDGQGAVTPPSEGDPTPDQSAVVSEIVQSNPDLVWATINPELLASIMGDAINQGYDGLWSGNSPTYSFKLLDTDIAPALDESYIASTYIVTWGTDVDGMDEVVEAMTDARPNLNVSDVYILGWTEAQLTHQVLEQAASNGDMTREGITNAAKEVTADFGGLAPAQTWSGEPNENLVRESYIYDVNLDNYNPAPLSEGDGDTGWELLEGPYSGELVQNYEWDGPCFVG